MKILPVAVAFALLAAPHAIAGEKAAAVLRCRAFAVGSAPAETLYVKSGGAYVPVVVSTDFVTPSFRADAKEGVVFYQKLPADPKAGGEAAKERFVPFVSCAPDGDAARQLVFLARGATGWTAVAKSDAEGAFPKGARLVINLSPRPVAFDFGGTRLKVEARKHGLLRGAAQVGEGGIAPIRMARGSAKGAWTVFFSGVWRQADDERNILLISPVPGSEEVTVALIQDTPEPPDAAEKKVAQRK